MKFKYYLRGIGIGIVVTTIIFMVLIAIHKNDEKQPGTLENDMQSKTVASVEEDTQTSPAPKEQSSQQKEETKKSTEKETEKETEKTAVPKETESEKEEEKEEQTKDDLQEKIRIEIGGGEFSDTVCRKLEAEGLIDDAKSFNEFLVEKDYDNSIMPGVYEIPKDSTYEEIAALLTTKVE